MVTYATTQLLNKDTFPLALLLEISRGTYFKAVLSTFFVTVMILPVVVIGVGVEGRLNIESQRSSLGPYWTFLVLTALQIEDNRHWPALQALTQESHDHLMALKCHSRLIQGLRKAATETKLMTLEQGTQWNMIVYCKFDIVCVEAGFFSSPVTIVVCAGQYSLKILVTKLQCCSSFLSHKYRSHPLYPHLEAYKACYGAFHL